MSKPDLSLFDGLSNETLAEQHWQNMPEFSQKDKSAHRQIIVSFDTDEDVAAFAKLIDQNITKKTKSVWFPERTKNNVKDLFWIGDEE
jgi:hypothetical protein